ncbi:SDR family NAD(P)-dependent oxidoreductase [Aurantimonas coralicida]|uniref:SDR family NAD(P)-dependent oxidoreductase n=1 Tax=Aurantimonas coralicida TaxID=182270 RepID=UPI0023858698|nr:SDR family oxidoreductase [Aurantimonas coralicida]MDE0880742.1 SDR family oxidoreductase [Sphingomonas bacterium]MDE0923331.1 SDR family oxidoreductase [Aurantimonas coralicida]
MNQRLAGRVALVTGAAQGIGATYAKALAEEGARVMISDIVDGERTAAGLRQKGLDVRFVKADVSDEASVGQMVDATVDAFGTVDILVANAAIYASLKMKPFDEIPVEEWDRVMAVNVRGAFLCAKAVSPVMKKNGYGRIITIASGTVFKGTSGFLHYVASKGAIVALSRALARELGDTGICVNVLAPGLVLSEQVVANTELRETLSGPVIASRAIKRDQQNDDLIGPLLFLASDDCAFMTGQTVVVDGGSVMH